ncbi:unnamed protein product [Mycena citricolor]|uniref:Uncharacterized protein n=1 Tax=Mycena citricolor TaxID=2018698 RepID=A0AAD2HV93_9AGAR|nr:unnamed protein product [Mycena citricolor]
MPARPGTRHPSPPSSSRSAEESPKPAFNSRIITSVRRTLSTATKRRDSSEIVHPSPEERNPFVQRFRYDTPATRPTVEQIAMGLHLSRTPHLHASTRYPALASHPQPTLKPVPLPPPDRSSMKKSNSGGVQRLTSSVSSATDVTSTTPSTPHSSKSSLRLRMDKMFPFRGSAVLPSSSSSSPRTSTSELQPRQKSVRFSAPPVEEED